MLQRFCACFTLLLVLGLSGLLMGDTSETIQYFPKTLGSYWVYEDQYGNELTRWVIEDQEVAGEMHHAFAYEPALEDWADYDYHIHPNFYWIGEEDVIFSVGREAETALKARLTKEVEVLRKTFEKMEPSFTIFYDVEAEAQDLFYVLPMPVNFDDKWNAMEIKAKITMRSFPPQDPEEITINFTIVETGTVVGTEDVETPAGTFEDCLRIQYQTETEVVTSSPEMAGSDMPGESFTTLWVSPNVGIVRIYQEAEDILLKTVPMLPGVEPPPTVRQPELNLELKRYEVKSADAEGK